MLRTSPRPARPNASRQPGTTITTYQVARSNWNPGISIAGLTLSMKETLLPMPTRLPSGAVGLRYEGNAVPGHAFGNVARITSSNSLLSAGF